MDCKCTKEGDIATLKATQKSMSDNIVEIKDIVKDGFKEINETMKEYVTKEEHNKNVKKIDKMEEAINGINLKIVFVSGGFASAIYIIEKLIK